MVNKDTFGTPLEVGDEVIYAANYSGSSAYLEKSTIAKFTPQNVRMTNGMLRSRGDCIRLNTITPDN